tara:strand:- start:388 stop:627 length:240 start_codon:yes stop_codon:yes gene_type:complete
MSIRSLALSLAVTGSLTMFLLTWWLIFNGYSEGPKTLVERVYIGFSFTPLGSLIGAFYGFIDFGIAGLIVGWLYNKFKK